MSKRLNAFGMLVDDDDEQVYAGELATKTSELGRARTSEDRGLARQGRASTNTGSRRAEAPKSAAPPRGKENTMPTKNDERAKKLLEVLRDAGPLTNQELQKELRLTKQQVRACVDVLRDDGEVEISGTRASARYHLPGQAVDAPLAKKKVAKKSTRRAHAPSARKINGSSNGFANGAAEPSPSSPVAMLMRVQEDLSNELARVNRAIAALQGE